MGGNYCHVYGVSVTNNSVFVLDLMIGFISTSLHLQLIVTALHIELLPNAV
jgi:uncharacterized membrane protein